MDSSFDEMPEISEKARNEMWNAGDLLWKMHRGQWRIELAYQESQGKLFVADCSRQLGKSTWSAIKSVETAIQKPGSRIRYATAFLTDLEQFIMPAFDYVVSDAPPSCLPRFRAQKVGIFVS